MIAERNPRLSAAEKEPGPGLTPFTLKPPYSRGRSATAFVAAAGPASGGFAGLASLGAALVGVATGGPGCAAGDGGVCAGAAGVGDAGEGLLGDCHAL